MVVSDRRKNELLAAFVAPGRGLELRNVDTPRIAAGEVLVRMRACGVCGTDLEKTHGTQITPPVLGHEVAGEIADVALGAEGLSVGDRVAVHHHVSCGICYYCKRGDLTMCGSYPETNLDPCGFAEFFRVPAANVSGGAVHRLSPKLGFEEGALVEPTACCIRGAQKLGLTGGEDVIIAGAGPVGLTFVQLVRMMGGNRIIVSDVIDARLEAAEKLGANVPVNPKREDLTKRVFEITEGRGADAAIVATGNAAALVSSLESIRKGGRALLFGAPPRGTTASVDLSRFFIRELSLVTSYSTTEREMKAALKLIQSGTLNLQTMITHRFPLKEAEEAFRVADEAKNALKVLVLN